jgi:hypothetical protein
MLDYQRRKDTWMVLDGGLEKTWLASSSILLRKTDVYLRKNMTNYYPILHGKMDGVQRDGECF